MKKYSIVIAMVLVLALTVSTFAASFADVPNNHWAYEAVNKLVAAGLIQGYPDGTFKGQNDLTRYEIAVMVGRLLNDMEEARAELVDQVDFMVNDALISANSGLSEAEAEQVQAIVEAVVAKNTPAEAPAAEVVVPQTLSEGQTGEVMVLIGNLAAEFAPELETLGVQVADLEARVDALESSSVSFSGEYNVEFNRTNVVGDELSKTTTDDGYVIEGYYKDPFASIDFKEEKETEGSNDDGSDDYRLAEDPAVYEDGDDLLHSVDLNVAISKNELNADLNMKAFKKTFGSVTDADDDTHFEFDSIEGTVTNGEFVATIKDGNSVVYKDYLFDDASLDGVVVDYDGNQLVLSKNTESETEDAFVIDPANYLADYLVEGGDDKDFHVDRDVFRAALKTGFDLFIPVNMYVGYEAKDEIAAGTDWLDWDDDDTGDDTATAFAATNNTVVAFDTTLDAGVFDVTADYAFNPGLKLKDSHLFRVNAVGSVDMIDITANFENTVGFNSILKHDDTEEDKEGYDVELATTLGVVDGSYKYADFGTKEHTIKAAVPADKLTLGEIAVDGSIEYITKENDDFSDIRKINAAYDLSGVALTYAYDYNLDNDDDFVDRVNDNDASTDKSEEDEDVNKHTFAASYDLTEAITTGAELELSKDANATHDDFVGDFNNTVTLTADYDQDAVTAGLEHVLDGKTTVNGRYTADMYEAGFEKVFNDGADSDLTVDAKVVAPTLTYASINVDSEVSFKRNMNDETQNLEVLVNAAKAVSDSLSLNAGFGWADKEIDVEFSGVKTTAGIGAEYKVSEDISANAGYDFFKFVEDGTAKEYRVNEATAGVSVAF